MKSSKSLLALLMAMILTMSLLAACNSRVQESSEESGLDTSQESSEGDYDKVEGIVPDFSAQIAEKNVLNEDTVGWIQVPGTDIDDVVVCNFEDNQYYLRRNFEKSYSFEGLYYADRRTTFENEAGEPELGLNTCIYGHAMTDDTEKDTYDVMFGPLHNFRDEDFAKEHPYIYFSSEDGNYVFEIIAVFVANTDNVAVPYNRNDIEPAEFVKMIKEEIFPRSKYLYDVDLKDTDKFLTLSTCIYTLDNGTGTNYPNTYYRFGIMARLVDPNEPIKEEAEFTLNPDVLYDPDGKWVNK